MLLYVRGDERSFEILYQRYLRPLLRMFTAHGVRPPGAQDLVQQTFLQLHRARNDFRPGAKLRPWLYTIAANNRRQFFRRHSRKPESPLDSAPEPSRSLDASIAAKHDLQNVLATLPNELVEVIALHWYGGLTFPEISQVLDIGVPAAKGRAHRGYAALRKQLNPTSDEKTG